MDQVEETQQPLTMEELMPQPVYAPQKPDDDLTTFCDALFVENKVPTFTDYQDMLSTFSQVLAQQGLCIMPVGLGNVQALRQLSTAFSKKGTWMKGVIKPKRLKPETAPY